MKKLFVIIAAMLVISASAFAQPAPQQILEAYQVLGKVGSGGRVCVTPANLTSRPYNDHSFIYTFPDGADSAITLTARGSKDGTNPPVTSVTTGTSTTGGTIHFTGEYTNICIEGTTVTGSYPATVVYFGTIAVTLGTVTTDNSGIEAILTNLSQKALTCDAGGDCATVTGSKLDVNASIDTTGLATLTGQTGGGQKSQIVDGSGNVIGATSNALDVNIKSGAATGYTHDVALTVGSTVGTMAMCRSSAAAPTDVSAGNDAVLPWCTLAGAQVVQLSSGGNLLSLGVGAAGTTTLRVATATDSTIATITNPVTVTDGAGALNVIIDSGTITTVSSVSAIIPGTGATNLGKAIDTATGATDTGVLLLATRDDVLAAITPVDGDNVQLRTDNTGALWVSVAVPSTLGVYVEDVAATAAGNLVMIGAVRRDTAASSSTTDGDNSTLNTDALGALWINCRTGCAGGTQYNVDVAAGAADTGTLALAVRDDALTTLTPVDGDYVQLRTNSTGALWVHSDVVDAIEGAAVATAPLPAGCVYRSSPGTLDTGDVGYVLCDTAGRLTVGDGSGAFNVIVDSGVITTVSTVTAVTTVSTVTSLSQLGGVALPVEDAAETAAGVGIYAMSVRRDTAATSANTTGDNATINTDAVGALWVNIATPTTMAIYVEDVAETAAGNLQMMGAVRRDTAASSSTTTGDNSTLNTNADGLLWTTTSPSATAGWTPFNATAADGATACTNSAQSVKGSQGSFGGYFINNPNTADSWLHVYNVASGSVTVGTTAPALTFRIPGIAANSAGANLAIPSGIQFSTAITIACTSTAAGNGAPSAALEADIWYK